MTKNNVKIDKRLYMIDSFRGLAIIFMVVYHAFYNIRYIFGNPFGWVLRLYPLQQAACWMFILISGFSFSFSRNNIRRGLLISACGLGLTGFTMLFMPSEKIVWGILSFLGAAMLLVQVLLPVLRSIPATGGFIVCAGLFVLFRDIQYGWLGFEGHWIAAVPAVFYRPHWLFPFGFPFDGFWSADYFPMLPWIFLYLCGFFLYRMTEKSQQIQGLLMRRVPVLAALGRHSLGIYLLHQPVIFGMMWLIFSVFSLSNASASVV